MLNPLPAIALLPLALLWFGLGSDAIVFTLLHSVVWPVALNAHVGFMSVSETQRMVGRNYGLSGLIYVIKLLIPAAFPSILLGLKIGWSYAWRTLIAAELVFGGSIIRYLRDIFWRPRLVHLLQPDGPPDRPRLRRPFHRHPRRRRCREPDLQHHREPHRPALGDAGPMSIETPNTKGPLPQLVIRPEFEVSSIEQAQTTEVARPLSMLERIWNINGVRKAVILLALVGAWQAYTVGFNIEPLMLPSFSASLAKLYDSLFHGDLIYKIWFSVKVLLIGYGAGLLLAAILILWATASRFGSDFIGMATAMFNPLPAIALLPLAMLWFGLGTASLVFVLIHSVLWAVALSTYGGFQSVSRTLRMIGQNYGLKGILYVLKILVPAALPSILSGMKIGWAFAWRTLIGAELVFGASSGSGGLGWYIFEIEPEHRNRRRLRRSVHGHPDRHRRRERRLPEHRASHRQPLGHATLNSLTRSGAAELHSFGNLPDYPLNYSNSMCKDARVEFAYHECPAQPPASTAADYACRRIGHRAARTTRREIRRFGLRRAKTDHIWRSPKEHR